MIAGMIPMAIGLSESGQQTAPLGRAVIGGVLALFIFARRRHLPFATWLDVLAPPLALGQAIGRWGNFFNQELYGAPSNLPWAIYIDPQHRYPGYQNVAYYHPLFLYESLWNLANMALLLWLSHRFRDRLRPGDIFLIYLIVYPVGRFLLEFLRMDASQVAGININQTIMGIVALVSAAVLVIRHLRRLQPDARRSISMDEQSH
jgi:phosphatidylglycerol:prolipoprotein diacylglycerol transferase